MPQFRDQIDYLRQAGEGERQVMEAADTEGAVRHLSPTSGAGRAIRERAMRPIQRSLAGTQEGIQEAERAQVVQAGQESGRALERARRTNLAPQDRVMDGH